METISKKVEDDEAPGDIVKVSSIDNLESESDVPPTRRQRISAIASVFFAGIAILSDGYNGAIIGNLDLVLSALYPVSFTSDIYTRVSNAFLIGEVFGMLFFGVLVDVISRKTGVIATTAILVLGIILSAAASGKTETGMQVPFTSWHIDSITGFGAGGEYPVCGAAALEAANGPVTRKHRGLMMSCVGDLMADLGFVVGGIVPLVVLFAFHQRHLEIVWRLCLAIGVILPLSVFWFRYKMVPSRQYEKHALRRKIPYGLILKHYWRPIVVTSALFFLYDFIAWPFSLFASTIFSKFNVGDSIWKNIAWGSFLADTKFGRRRMMATGFFVQAILGFIIGGVFNSLVANAFGAFVFLYALFVATGEVGPGSGIILVSAESFPTAIRGQGLGIASAFGKAGAAIGAQVFTAILARYDDAVNPNQGSQVAFLIGSGFAVLGAIVAFFGLVDQRADLEVQDREFRVILESEGYDTTDMGYAAGKESMEEKATQ
ncbi:metabolite transport protein [Pseudohyphozyma bogoriensis]|nr:metabolite transport protein [Pseudohyphozyma bogoriensis]